MSKMPLTVPSIAPPAGYYRVTEGKYQAGDIVGFRKLGADGHYSLFGDVYWQDVSSHIYGAKITTGVLCARPTDSPDQKLDDKPNTDEDHW